MHMISETQFFGLQTWLHYQGFDLIAQFQPQASGHLQLQNDTWLNQLQFAMDFKFKKCDASFFCLFRVQW